jgi:hypothetical protein
MKHVLLEKMYLYPIRPQQEDSISDFEYDEIKGYWKNRNSKTPLIFDKLAIGPRTKKEDVETGEDRKSE